MLAEGQPAPDFTLNDQDGTPVRLANLRGHPVVLYFYPKDDTLGCTREACAFRDARSNFEQRGARIVGISPDDVAAHRRFADKYGLTFTLLADPDRTVCDAYGVWQEKTLYGRKSMGVVRTTYALDANGIIRKVFPRVRVDGHAEKVLAALNGL
jgi:peroxiredoxin Q/BCP